MGTMQRLVVGIDGGATTSHGVAVDATGAVCAMAHAGSLSFFGSSLAETRRNLSRLKAALPPVTDVENFVVSSAALFDEATPDQKEMLCLGILPLERTRLLSDCQSALFGATLGQPGLLVISGTGSISVAQNADSKIVKVGGWGHLLGDEGSAYWIASEAIKAAIAAATGLGPATTLGESVCGFFKVRSLEDLIPVLHHPHFTKEKLAALARHLTGTVASADSVLQTIFTRAGCELARQALAAAKLCNLRLDPIPLYLVGRVIEKNSLVRDSFLATIRREINVAITPPKLSPPLGAAALALVDSGITLTDDVVTRLASSFQKFAVAGDD
ncbi:MAG: hypothetical protein HY043_21135 [Verrucomicrobia bacterium]|nr:hypothetical protein [Verrucomicrobiota bacterium]